MPSDRTPAKAPPQNPTTPVVPRVRAAQRTPATSTSLHPNVTTRSPKSLARKARAESVASPDSPYHSLTPRPYVPRPSSAASNRSFASASNNVTPSRLSREESNGSPMFFHASEVSNPAASSQQPTYTATPHVSSTGPKFFHADGAPSVVGGLGEQVRLGSRAPRGSTAGSQLSSNTSVLAPSPSTRSINHSPPSSRPSSMVNFPTSPRPSSVVAGNPRASAPITTPAILPSSRNLVKFVYANGTEELLPPREPASEIGPTSPQLSSSPMCSGASSSSSPTKVTYPLSPLASPSGPSSPSHYFQRQTGSSSSRRSSIDVKARHGRGLSISSVVELSIPTNEENGDADDEGHRGSGGSGSSSEEPGEEEGVPPPPPPMTAAERIKLMEERSANSRRERKVYNPGRQILRRIVDYYELGHGSGDI
jgi:hypothetical protein